jgi:hypothetical protein
MIGVSALLVPDSLRLQPKSNAKAIIIERAALRARVFEVDILGSSEFGGSILHDWAESVALPSNNQLQANGLFWRSID